MSSARATKPASVAVSNEETFSQPAELTALIDKSIIATVRKAILAKTNEAIANGADADEGYAALTAHEFKVLLGQAGIPRTTVEKITQHIDVNDDGMCICGRMSACVYMCMYMYVYVPQHADPGALTP